MLRPTTRVCHARQDIQLEAVKAPARRVDFKKDPARWAATPKFRFQLHRQLEEKLIAIAGCEKTAPLRRNPGFQATRAIVVSGVAAAHAEEIIKDRDLWNAIPLYQVLQPYPLHRDFISHLFDSYAEVLVIEETAPVIEMQLADRHRVKGKLTGTVPGVGELLPESIEGIIGKFAGVETEKIEMSAPAGRRPTLCAGCPHRASFFAIKKAAPKGIYPSDIGCYTLGLNLGAVDTVLCMGAAISQAAGFYHAYKHEEKRPDIVASIGDSTFFHAGVPALIDAVVQGARFVLVILDNQTTAMTGNQPTPATADKTGDESLNTVDIETLVRGCGIEFCKVGDPYEMDKFIPLVKEAVQHSRDKGPAVVISRHPCLIDRFHKRDADEQFVEVEISATCDGCGYCIEHFECPALIMNDEDQVIVDTLLCNGCGVCLHVCPKKSIIEKK